MGACRECIHSSTVGDDLTRCFHQDAPSAGYQVPSSFRWCKHHKYRGVYYHLKYPAPIEPLEERPGIYRVRIGRHSLNLPGHEIHDLFEKVAPHVAEATARIIKEDFA